MSRFYAKGLFDCNLRKLFSCLVIIFSFSILFFVESSAIAGKSINEESPSLKIAKKYEASFSGGAVIAFEAFEDSELSPEEVNKSWTPNLSHEKMCCAPFHRKPESIQRYREIIIAESDGELYSYHGYDRFSAGLYDIYTTVAEVLNGNPVAPRSRFRFNSRIKPYKSSSDFLENVKFYSDHEEKFTLHGISAVPHLFSNTAFLAENCLTGLQAPFLQSSPETVENLIRGLGFKDSTKYISLIEKHLSGGFITRFTFSDESALNLATYPAPNPELTRRYGQPWRSPSSGEVISSADFYKELQQLEQINEVEYQSFLFNMQYRNIFVPEVYNNQDLIQTRIFSRDDLRLDDYYQLLGVYVKEDMKSLSIEQLEQAELWLK